MNKNKLPQKLKVPGNIYHDSVPIIEAINALIDFLTPPTKSVEEMKRVELEGVGDNNGFWEMTIKGKCNGAHCKCMNIDKTCPNFHYGDHDCPFSTPKSTNEENMTIEEKVVIAFKEGQSSQKQRMIKLVEELKPTRPQLNQYDKGYKNALDAVLHSLTDSEE